MSFLISNSESNNYQQTSATQNDLRNDLPSTNKEISSVWKRKNSTQNSSSEPHSRKRRIDSGRSLPYKAKKFNEPDEPARHLEKSNALSLRKDEKVNEKSCWALDKRKKIEETKRVFEHHLPSSAAERSSLKPRRETRDSDPRLITYNKRINQAAKNYDVEECKKILKDIAVARLKADAFSYNPIINIYVRKQNVQSARALFEEMTNAGVHADAVTFNSLINLFVRKEDAEGAYAVFEEMKKAEVHPNEVTFTSLINLFVRKEDVEGAFAVLHEMKKAGVHPNAVTFTSLINLFVRKEDVEGAYAAFKEMKKAGVDPNAWTFTSLINLFVRKGDAEGAYAVFEEMTKAGVHPDAVTFTSLINLFVRKEDVEGAYAVFEDITNAGVHPDAVTFNSLINLFVRKEDVEGAYAVFEEMKKAGVRPDAWTFTSLINLFVRKEDAEGAYAVFEEMTKAGIHPNACTFNSLINLFVRKEDAEGAYAVFEEMKKGVHPDAVTFTSLINLFVRKEDAEGAYAVFEEMKKGGVQPDEVTFNILKKLANFSQSQRAEMSNLVETVDFDGKTQVLETQNSNSDIAVIETDLLREPKKDQDLLDCNKNKPKETLANTSPPFPLLASYSERECKGGYLIDTKYLENFHDVSKIKEPFSTSGASFPWLQTPSFSLKPVASFYPGKKINEYSLKIDGFKVRYLSSSDQLPQKEEICTFVVLGRGERGLIPLPSKGHRIILIVEKKQADEMVKHAGLGVDVAVINAVDGVDLNAIGRPTVRRLAALTFARYFGLSHMLMADDNLHQFFLSHHVETEDFPSWQNVFEAMKEACQQGELCCVTARTFRPEFCKERPNGQLVANTGKIGSKLFMIDMSKLKHCNSLQDLLPPDPILWGEDLFFQLAVQALGEKIGVIDYTTMVFVRSKKNRNSATKRVTFADAWLKIHDVWPHSGERVSDFHKNIIREIQTIIARSNEQWKERALQMSQKKVHTTSKAEEVAIEPSTTIPPQISHPVSKEGGQLAVSEKPCQTPAIQCENELACTNLPSKKRNVRDSGVPVPVKRRRAEIAESNLDVSETKSKTNILNLDNGHFNLKGIVFEFKGQLKGLLSETQEEFRFRKCQIEGFKALQSKLPNECGYLGYFDMFTGSGKSIMIYCLANLFMNCKNYSKNVLIVTPRISLVEQLSQEYIAFCKRMHTNPKPLFTISSSDTTGQEILTHERWQKNSSIGFCCTKTLENNPEILEMSPVVIVDEFHTIHNEQFLEKLETHSGNGAIVLQFSATPPEDAKGELIFKYSDKDARKDQVVAPSIYHDLEINLNSKASIEKFIKNLPSFLKTHHHPHGGTLSQNRGIIFAPYLKTMGTPSAIAKRIADTLQNEQINALAILSDTHETVVNDFRNSKEARIAVVVRKLELGFDTACDWIMILRGKNENKSGCRQKIGRVVRQHMPTFDYEKPDVNERMLEHLSLKQMTEDDVTERFLELWSLQQTLRDLNVKPPEISTIMEDLIKPDFSQEGKIAYILKPKGMHLTSDMPGIDTKTLKMNRSSDAEKVRFDPDFWSKSVPKCL